jgi:hypothetical protein
MNAFSVRNVCSRLWSRTDHQRLLLVSSQSSAAGQKQGHYTPITKQLWLDRIDAASKHASDTVTELITHKHPEETRVVYPFSTNVPFKELYRNPWNFIRIGCILEDLDSLAGNIAFQHWCVCHARPCRVGAHACMGMHSPLVQDACPTNVGPSIRCKCSHPHLCCWLLVSLSVGLPREHTPFEKDKLVN